MHRTHHYLVDYTTAQADFSPPKPALSLGEQDNPQSIFDAQLNSVVSSLLSSASTSSGLPNPFQDPLAFSSSTSLELALSPLCYSFEFEDGDNLVGATSSDEPNNNDPLLPNVCCDLELGTTMSSVPPLQAPKLAQLSPPPPPSLPSSTTIEETTISATRLPMIPPIESVDACDMLSPLSPSSSSSSPSTKMLSSSSSFVDVDLLLKSSAQLAQSQALQDLDSAVAAIKQSSAFNVQDLSPATWLPAESPFSEFSELSSPCPSPDAASRRRHAGQPHHARAKADCAQPLKVEAMLTPLPLSPCPKEAEEDTQPCKRAKTSRTSTSSSCSSNSGTKKPSDGKHCSSTGGGHGKLESKYAWDERLLTMSRSQFVHFTRTNKSLTADELEDLRQTRRRMKNRLYQKDARDRRFIKVAKERELTRHQLQASVRRLSARCQRLEAIIRSNCPEQLTLLTESQL
eukprot:m.60755 g.60755  ORF g.60755 m.60755 type:complete len:458 (-) comp13301_c1_seq1:370-1743(-)